MASLLLPFPTAFNSRRQSSLTKPAIYNCAAENRTPLSTPVGAYKFDFHRPFRFRRNYWSGRCRAAVPPPEPPSEKYRPSTSGLAATFTRVKDTLQVFFAVLFWMSLFFWSSAWDGGNNGRPNKRTRNRK
ncbi:uncharacterized protein LOC127263123 [Andrographis paniculata]|uniref:uncharacterized protein LOC127263123 n=1 Tax=Andrographis paniculata TaxID=175694 RepID=UPI0021E784CF|nr:uncharacterized protein LOC127263123 [Andrographis paniculata]